MANDNPDPPATDPTPPGYGTVTPFVIVHGVDRFMDFAQEAFDAADRGRMRNEDGTIAHGELQIGGSVVMCFDAQPHWPSTPSFLALYVADCDRTHQAAVDAGAVTVTPLSTNPWGDRGSRIRDPLGNIWWIQTHVEDVDDEEMTRRMSSDSFQDDLRISTETLDAAMTNFDTAQ